jgi:hypothetical protein
MNKATPVSTAIAGGVIAFLCLVIIPNHTFSNGWSINRAHAICSSTLGQIGSAFSGTVAQKCGTADMYMNICHIVGWGAVIVAGLIIAASVLKSQNG